MLCTRTLAATIVCLLALAAAAEESQLLPIPNGNFEKKLEGWTVNEPVVMSSLSTEEAASGKHSLKIVDAHDVHGSGIASARVPIKGAGAFELRGKVFPVSGSGLGIYPHVFDADGKMIGAGDAWHRGAPADPKGKWREFRVPVYTTDNARFLEVWFHSYSHAHVVAYLDDVHFVDVSDERMKPPWEGTYKIRPDEKDKLTEADVVGPDGIVYPDWTYAGVPGGIPDVPVKAKLEDFGGQPDDGRDDSEALQKAADAVGEQGGGGTAYVGWQHTSDCLMENVVSYKQRHAPCVQWAASGNVIRKSVFHESDGQWHAGWTNENLFEQCTIDATQGNGAYGYGFWASPPEDTAHGPNGPRNVVYNCDVKSPKSGLWMGGMNENWLILHNRFVVDKGPGVFAKTASFDHILKGNVFVLKEKGQSALMLATPDCLGVEFAGNRVYGEGATPFAGAATLAIDEGNEVARPDADAQRPKPAVPSIFEWQRENVRR